MSKVSGKVLVVLSSADRVKLASGDEKETGFFLPELAKPLRALLDKGFDVQFANPLGNRPNMDPMSESLFVYGGNKASLEADKKLIEQMKKSKFLDQPRKLSSFTIEELHGFSGVLIPGGHAPIVDLDQDKDLGRILLYFHGNHKPIGAICHGPIALLSTMQLHKPWSFEGYKMSCYSNAEEKMNELMWWDTVTKKVEQLLREAGGIMIENFPMLKKVVKDRELVTAQGFTSAYDFGEAFTHALVEYVQTYGAIGAKQGTVPAEQQDIKVDSFTAA